MSDNSEQLEKKSNAVLQSEQKDSCTCKLEKPLSFPEVTTRETLLTDAPSTSSENRNGGRMMCTYHLPMWLLQKLLVCKLAAWMIEHLYTVACLGGGWASGHGSHAVHALV